MIAKLMQQVSQAKSARANKSCADTFAYDFHSSQESGFLILKVANVYKAAIMPNIKSRYTVNLLNFAWEIALCV